MRTTIIIYCVCLLSSFASAFSGSGSGIESNPYVITTIEQLQEIQDDLEACYVLGNDIDASATASWNDGAGFEPIGYSLEDGTIVAFTGTFNGQCHVISNLYINRPGTDGVGLFGHINDGAVIENVGLDTADISARRDSGLLVGNLNNSIIGNSWSSGDIRGTYNGQMRLGGLVGISTGYNSLIYQCFSSSNITAFGGAQQIGGLAGYNGHGSVISDCYATGHVSGTSKVGGLVGDNIYGSRGTLIERCYSTGKLSGDGGGLVGSNWNDGVTTDSYWDINTSGKSSSYGGTGKTTTQMMQQSTFAGWDFENVWLIEEDQTYPYLVPPICTLNDLVGRQLNEAIEHKIRAIEELELAIGNETIAWNALNEAIMNDDYTDLSKGEIQYLKAKVSLSIQAEEMVRDKIYININVLADLVSELYME